MTPNRPMNEWTQEELLSCTAELLKEIQKRGYFSEHVDIDMDQLIRNIVVKKAIEIDPSYLPKMMNDEYEGVRQIVVYRIDPSYLPQMMNDKQRIRESIARRIDPSYLPQMMNDTSWEVRENVARRIDPSYLPQMLYDKKYFNKCLSQEKDDDGSYRDYLSWKILEIKGIVFERIPRELVPKKFLKEFDEFHVKKVIES